MLCGWTVRASASNVARGAAFQRERTFSSPVIALPVSARPSRVWRPFSRVWRQESSPSELSSFLTVRLDHPAALAELVALSVAVGRSALPWHEWHGIRHERVASASRWQFSGFNSVLCER